MRDCFVQVRIEFLAGRVDWLKAALGEKIHELFKDHAHPGKDGRLLALGPRGVETELEVVDNSDQFFEERAVGVLDRFVLLPRRSFFVILEVRLTSKREIAKPIEVRLQTLEIVLRLRGFRGLNSRIFLLRVWFSYRNFFHVLRMAIKVMSSFCGCAPTKARSSSMIRVIIAGAPSDALVRTHSIIRSGPNSSPSASSASVTPSV